MSRDAEAKVDAKTARLFDKRTVERNIKRGLISRKDYDKYLKSLDDIADKGVYGAPAEDEAEDVEDVVDSDEGPTDPGHEGNSHT